MALRLRTLFLVACATVVACASESVLPALGWSGLQRQMSREQAFTVLQPAAGAPLIMTRSRDGRFEVWNYDRGAYLLFVGGALDCWSAPRSTDSRSKP